ncbi:hypothetical protein [Changpingibacter yushuensis]|nr:hypothetical protein [Changpingibacter yushuensis]
MRIMRIWAVLTRALVRVLDAHLSEDVASAWYEAAWSVDDWKSNRD